MVGVGLGIETDFFPVGQHFDAQERARWLDERLEIIGGHWSGEPRAPGPTGHRFARRPLERRDPATAWQHVRAARTGRVAECATYVSANRSVDDPFALVASWFGPRNDGPSLADHERAGATWGLDGVNPWAKSLREYAARINMGPLSNA